MAQRHAIRLDDIERIVLEQIPGIVEPNVEQLGTLEYRIGYIAVAQDTSVLLQVSHVIDVTRMNAVFLARMRKGERKIFLPRALPFVLAARSPALVVQIETRRGRNVLGMRDPQALFQMLRSARHEIGKVGERLFDIEEPRPLGGHQISVESLSERKVAILGSQKEIEAPPILPSMAEPTLFCKNG